MEAVATAPHVRVGFIATLVALFAGAVKTGATGASGAQGCAAAPSAERGGEGEGSLRKQMMCN